MDNFDNKEEQNATVQTETVAKKSPVLTKIIVLIASLTAVFVLGFVITTAMGQNPKSALANAFSKTNKEFSTGSSPLIKTDLGKNNEQKFSLWIDELNLGSDLGDMGMIIDILKSFKFSINTQYSADEKKLAFDTDMSLFAEDFALVDMFISEDIYGLALPYLKDNMFTFNPKNFVDDWNSSALGTNFGEIPEGVIDFESFSKIFFDQASKNETDELEAKFKEAHDKLFEKAIVEKDGNVITSTFTKEDVNEFYLTIVNEYIAIMESSMDVNEMLAPLYGDLSDVDTGIAEIKNALHSLSVTSDLVMKVETNKSGTISKLTIDKLEIKESESGEAVAIKDIVVAFEYSNDGNVMKMDFVIDDSTDDTVTCSLTLNSKSSDSVNDETVSVTMKSGSEEVTFNFSYLLDTKKTENNFDISFDMDFMQEFKFNGYIKGDLASDKTSYSLKNGKIGFSTNIEGEEISAVLGIETEAKAGADVKLDESKTKELRSITDEDIMEMYQVITDLMAMFGM